MSFLSKWFGPVHEGSTTEAPAPAIKEPQCPYGVGSTTMLVKNRIDFEFTEIEEDDYGWTASGNAIVTLPPGAKNIEIKEIVNAKYGSVEGFSVHFETSNSKRAVTFGKEYRKNLDDDLGRIEMEIDEVVVKTAIGQ